MASPFLFKQKLVKRLLLFFIVLTVSITVNAQRYTDGSINQKNWARIDTSSVFLAAKQNNAQINIQNYKSIRNRSYWFLSGGLAGILYGASMSNYHVECTSCGGKTELNKWKPVVIFASSTVFLVGTYLNLRAHVKLNNAQVYLMPNSIKLMYPFNYNGRKAIRKRRLKHLKRSGL